MGIEIERKFLVKHLPPTSSITHTHVVEQGYLSTNPVVRVRICDDHLAHDEHNGPCKHACHDCALRTGPRSTRDPYRMEKMMKEFTIKRSQWLRGEGSDESYLRRDDDKRCCLGFYLEACGVDLLDINAKSGSTGFPRTPAHVFRNAQEDPNGRFYPEEANWLLNLSAPVNLSTASNELMKHNDSRCYAMGPEERKISEEGREAKIVEIFKNHGITVKFED